MKRFFLALSIVVLGSIAAVSAQGARRPISLDDLGRLKEVRDPQCAPDGKSVALRRVADRRQGRQGGQRAHLDGRPRRPERAADYVEHRQRVVAEVQSRRQVSVLHVIPSGQSQRESGVAAGPRRRRGISAHRDQGPAPGVRMVAGLEAAGVDDWRSGS